MSLFNRHPRILVDHPQEFILRPFQEQDRSSLIQMVRTRFEDVGMDLDLEDVHHDLSDIEGCWKEQGGEFMVLLHQSQVVGSLCVRPLKERHGAAEADWFFFDKRFEGKGLSLLLFKWIATWCEQNKIHYIELWSSEDRTWAHRIYKKLGFKHNGVKRYYSDTNPPCYRLYFELELSPDTLQNAQQLFNKI